MNENDAFSSYFKNLQGETGDWLSSKNKDDLSEQYPLDHKEYDRSEEIKSVIGFCFHILDYDPVEQQPLAGLSDTELAEILTKLITELKSSETAKQKFQPTEDLPSLENLINKFEVFARSFDLLPILDLFRESGLKGEDDILKRQFERIREHEELVNEAQKALTEAGRDEDNKRELEKDITQLKSFIDRNKPLLIEKEELVLQQRSLKSGEKKQEIKERVNEIEKLVAEGSVDLLYLTFDIKRLIKDEPPVENNGSFDHRGYDFEDY